MRVKNIVADIRSGKMSRDIDEAYAGGFWDLAGQLAGGNERLQEALYNIFYDITEATQ